MTTGQTISVGLAGIGGYGGNYLAHMLDRADDLGVRLVGAVDPYPERSPHLARLQATDVPIYADLEAFYARHAPDLFVIASPIHHHMPQTRLALRRGAHVLCEKPLAATIQDGLETLEVEQESGRFVAIGYNWSFTHAIQALKRDILAGVFGRSLRLKSLVLWPRWQPYYTRNRWAGHIRDNTGTWILDSPVNNATAHYLHNLFYLLGDAVETSAQPVDVQAERYRANAIENYDTAALRAHTADGTEILFYTAHPVPENIGPIFHLEFEQAVITYNGRDSEILAQFHDGRIHSYQNPDANAHTAKLPRCIDNVRSGGRPLCGIEAATAQTRCMNGAQESGPIVEFPRELIHDEGDRGWVEGLSGTLLDCYQHTLLPSERGDVAWARAGAVIDLRGYNHFPNPDLKRD